MRRIIAAIVVAVIGAWYWLPPAIAQNPDILPVPGVLVSPATTQSFVVKSSAGNVVSVSGSIPTSDYVMIFNAASIPTNGAVTPVKCFGPMQAAGPFVAAWGVGPVLHLATGITVAVSSTGCFNLTIATAPFLSVEYQ